MQYAQVQLDTGNEPYDLHVLAIKPYSFADMFLPLVASVAQRAVIFVESRILAFLKFES